MLQAPSWQRGEEATEEHSHTMVISRQAALLLLAGLLLTLGTCHALERSDCDKMRKKTLKFIKEMPFSGLFRCESGAERCEE